MKISDQHGKNALITGGGSGLGKALAIELSRHGSSVVIIGRNEQALAKTQQESPDLIRYIVSDLSESESWQSVADQLGSLEIDYLVHNAATIGPVTRLDSIRLDEWRKTIRLNTEAPLFLTQRLKQNMTAGTRVLFVSSAAATTALGGFGAYCCSKAALQAVCRSFRQDLGGRIGFSSVSPGMLDTDMQKNIRAQDEVMFPIVKMFQEARQSHMLTPATDAASFVSWVLTQTSLSAFTSIEWDFDNTDQASLWKKNKRI